MLSKETRNEIAKIRNQYRRIKKRKCEEFIRQIDALIEQISSEKKSVPKNKIVLLLQELEEYKEKTVNRCKPKSRRLNYVVKTVNKAFRKNIITVCVVNFKYKDLEKFFSGVKSNVIKNISYYLKNLRSVKIYAMLTALFENSHGQEKLIYLYTKTIELQKSACFNTWYETEIKQKLRDKISEFQEGESNLTLKEIVSLKFFLLQYAIVKGGTYVSTAKCLLGKKAILNIKNSDDYCFLHCINAQYNRVSRYLIYYPPIDNLNMNIRNLKFPLKLCDVSKFEAQNPFSINVFEIDENNEIIFCHKTKNYKGKDKHVNLFLLENKHFALITNLSGLCRQQLSYKRKAKFFCDQCISFFLSQEILDKHLKNCLKFNNVKYEFPADDFIKFNNIANQFRLPFIIYADSECILKNVTDINLKGAHTEHEAHSIGFYFLSDFEQVPSAYECKREKNVSEWFAKQLKMIAYEIQDFLQYSFEPIRMSDEEEEAFENAEKCYVCDKPFSIDDWKVKDHSHISGSYRGAAHNTCNLKGRKNYTIPIVMHNSANYDMHLVIRNVIKHIPGRVDVIAKNTETYIGVTVRVADTWVRLKFIDSYKFLPCKLEKLADFLPNENKQLIRNFCDNDEEFDLLNRKGFFPYEYLTSFEKLEDDLPPIEDFDSSLRGKTTSQEDYQHVQNMWNTFKKKFDRSVGKYLMVDGLLLCCIFKGCRKTSLQTFSLDPAHYYESPGLAWDAFLKQSDIELEIIKDIDIYNFFEIFEGDLRARSNGSVVPTININTTTIQTSLRNI